MARKRKDEDELLIEEDELTAAFFDDEEMPEEADEEADEEQHEEPEDEYDFLEEGAVGQLAVDVYETDKELVVKAPIAGVNKDSIDVSIADNTLTIHGTRVSDSEKESTSFFVQECYWGEFSRSLVLPVQVKEDEVDAQLKDGVLTIRFEKVKQDTIKRIEIR